MLFPLALAAQPADLPPDVLLLSQAMRHIREGILAVPNYTCLETIVRERRPPRSRSFERLDLVRLEVAKDGPRELFAWPGARKFEDRPATDFVVGGLIGNGAFALFADDLFVNGAATMKVRGPDPLDGRNLIRVDYSVHPIGGSGMNLTTATGSADVNYSGSWWLDPATLNLVRLDVIADNIPFQLRLSLARIVIEYGDSGSATLPRAAMIEFTADSGELSRDSIAFAHCRRFSGSAELILGEPDAEPASRLAPSATFLLPGDLWIPLRMETAIDLNTAGVGDEIAAVVEKDVRDKQRLWLPTGSVVRGRIRRLEGPETSPGYPLIGLEFSEAEAGGEKFDFVARLDRVDRTANVRTSLSVKDFRDTNRHGVVEANVTEYSERAIPGVGYLYLTSAPYRIATGLRMVLKTEAVRQAVGKGE